jgi:hypothetical protein
MFTPRSLTQSPDAGAEVPVCAIGGLGGVALGVWFLSGMDQPSATLEARPAAHAGGLSSP